MKDSIKFIVLFIIFLVLLVLCFKMVINHLIPSYPEVENWEPYVVERGDTLWEICPRIEGYDIRVLIDMVNEYNNMHSDIKAGQVIMLPVYKEGK